MKMLVLGAGLQGSACAYDLLHSEGVTQVTLADLKIDRLPPFLERVRSDKLVLKQLDGSDHAAVRQVMTGHDAVMSALPYYFNGPMAALAVECGCHFSDLGGNTEIVFEQKKLDAAAAAKGLSIIPDCGLAPGMVAILAAEGIRRLDKTERVRIYVGGLPQTPRAPAQLPDRLFPRGRARLLHHPVLGAAWRQAGAGGRAERAGDGGVPLAGRPARGVPHRRGHQHAAVQVRGPGGRHGVQDAPLSRPRRHHAPHPGAGPAGRTRPSR